MGEGGKDVFILSLLLLLHTELRLFFKQKIVGESCLA